MRKRKVERTISSGNKKSNASLLGGVPGGLGASTTMLVIAEDCERAASAMSSPTIRGTEETKAGCDSMTDGIGTCTLPMVKIVGCIMARRGRRWGELGGE